MKRLTRLGQAGVILGLGLTTLSAMGGAAVQASPSVVEGSNTLQLQNNSAESFTSGSGACAGLDPTQSFFHFVIAPNNGTYAFESITLNLGGTYSSYMGAIIPNGTQLDNVFVQVPTGSSPSDLQTSGSSAVITPAAADDSVKFVLSHICIAATVPESSSTVPESSTTSTTMKEEESTSTTAKVNESTTTSTTTKAAVTTTEAPTTTEASNSPVTVSSVASLAPVVITPGPTTTAGDVAAQAGPLVAPSGASLPVTGTSDTALLLTLGLSFLVVGSLLMVRGRRAEES